MNRIDLFSFYKLGELLQCASETNLANPGINELLTVGRAKAGLTDFLRSVESGLRRSKGSAGNVLKKLNELEAALLEERIIADHEIHRLREAVDDFGTALESESRYDLRVFAVAPKGLYDTAKLVDHAEDILSNSPLGLIIYTLLRLNKVYGIPVMHPRMTLTPETAEQVFELATDVIKMICDDLSSRSESSDIHGIATADSYMIGP